MRRDKPLALAPNAYRLIAGCERRYEYAEPLLLFPEIDGVRIVGPKQTELLRRVADATEGALRVGSRAPAARLIAASEAFDEGDAASEEMRDAIGEEGIAEGVLACVRAAEFELSAKLQQRLVRAARYGKVYVEDRIDSPSFARAPPDRGGSRGRASSLVPSLRQLTPSTHTPTLRHRTQHHRTA